MCVRVGFLTEGSWQQWDGRAWRMFKRLRRLRKSQTSFPGGGEGRTGELRSNTWTYHWGIVWRSLTWIYIVHSMFELLLTAVSSSFMKSREASIITEMWRKNQSSLYFLSSYILFCTPVYFFNTSSSHLYKLTSAQMVVKESRAVVFDHRHQI